MNAHAVEKTIVEIQKGGTQKGHYTRDEICFAFNEVIYNATSRHGEKQKRDNREDVEVHAVLLAEGREQFGIEITKHYIYHQDLNIGSRGVINNIVNHGYALLESGKFLLLRLQLFSQRFVLSP